MDELLRLESERLARSWMQHGAEKLRDYLVASVEDPRINLQSILTRHFLVRALTAERFRPLMEQEYRFAAVGNWLLRLIEQGAGAEEFQALLYALRRGADNADGTPIPRFVVQTFASLPASAAGRVVPNYLQVLLSGAGVQSSGAPLSGEGLRTFEELWSVALAQRTDPAPQGGGGAIARPAGRLSALEAACGSANDFRFLHRYGIARHLDYTGFDLCARNIANARAMFPGVDFEEGNVFDIAAPDAAFEVCFVHDLFEHLSPEGFEAAVKELCRVTRRGLCLGFFNMDEIPEDRIRPLDEYHWNTLSMARARALFAAHGFAAQVIHVGTFLRRSVGCEWTHNPNAYTFFLERERPVAADGAG